MNSICFIAVLFITFSGVISEGMSLGSREEMPGATQTRECHIQCRKYSRKCDEAILSCGSCMHNHIEHDGECLKVERDAEILNPGEDIDRMVQEHHHHSPKHVNKVEEIDLAVKDVNQADSNNVLPETTETPSTTVGTPHHEPVVQHPPPDSNNPLLSSAVFIAVVAGCSVAGLVGLVVAGVCWYRLQKNVKAASDVDYPAYGVTGPANNKEQVSSPGSTGGDRKLAQSAQMYHYQHQKQQMIALEKANNDMNKDGSEVDSEEENEEGDYTVFECPGLAPTGEMEVKNPLFSEETPVTPETQNKQK